ncbi:MAG: hypothetical protein ACHQUC_06695 [Chlamydiales bacterium]
MRALLPHEIREVNGGIFGGFYSVKSAIENKNYLSVIVTATLIDSTTLILFAARAPVMRDSAAYFIPFCVFASFVADSVIYAFGNLFATKKDFACKIDTQHP